MKPKTKITVLGCVSAALALIYAATFVFDSAGRASGRAAYTWLDAKALTRVDGLVIRAKGGEEVTLSRASGAWTVEADGEAYPAKATRVDDLLAALSAKGAYPVRATSSAAAGRLGLDEADSARLTVKAGAAVLLDLLVGDADATGAGVYLRKADSNEVRSGKDSVSSYTSGGKSAWYDLRVFGDYAAAGLDLAHVQRVIADPPRLEPPTDGTAGEEAAAARTPFTLERDRAAWKLAGEDTPVDTNRAESYVRTILDTTAEGFEPSGAISTGNGSLTLEFDNGQRRILHLGAKADSATSATLTGGPNSTLVYRLSDWTIDRLFRTPGDS